jgi:cytochrome c oxidase subunit 3
MALAVRAAKMGQRNALTAFLGATILLGLAFLAVKAFEYHTDYVEHLVPRVDFKWDGPGARQAEIFFWLYFTLTGLHAVHVTIGIGILATLAWRGRFYAGNDIPVEISGLYWHFVDIVWVFLFPLLYLAGHR